MIKCPQYRHSSMEESDEINRRTVIRSLGAAGAATSVGVFSDVASANEKDNVYLEDEEMDWYEKYHYGYYARQSDDFDIALNKVRERGFEEIAETTGVIRTGSLLTKPIRIIGFRFEKDSGNEAMISAAFTGSDETKFSVRFTKSDNGADIQSADNRINTVSNEERYLVEGNELVSSEGQDGQTLKAFGSGPCGDLNHIHTANGNDICYALVGGFLIVGGLVAIVSPAPGDSAVVAKVSIAELSAGGACFIVQTAKREAEKEGIECDNLKFHVCATSLTRFMSPVYRVVPECIDD